MYDVYLLILLAVEFYFCSMAVMCRDSSLSSLKIMIFLFIYFIQMIVYYSGVISGNNTITKVDVAAGVIYATHEVQKSKNGSLKNSMLYYFKIRKIFDNIYSLGTSLLIRRKEFQGCVLYRSLFNTIECVSRNTKNNIAII